MRRDEQDLAPQTLAQKAEALGGVWGAATPRFICRRAEGFRIQDVEGRWYDDLTSSKGTVILGAAHPDVSSVLRDLIDRGLPATSAREISIEVAWMIRELFPEAERISLHGSTKETLEAAVRLARHVTDRDVILEMRSRETFDEKTRTIEFGDLFALENALKECAGEVAAILLEPITPEALSPGDLKTIRMLADEHGALLIFDESMTAFRLAPRGVQSMINVIPDLTCTGESLAGGMPFGSMLGKASLLDRLGEAGVYTSLDGDVMALTAVRATLSQISEKPVAEQARNIGEQLRDAFSQACKEHNVHGRMFGPAGRMDLSFQDQENADGGLIEQTFRSEMMRCGLIVGGIIYPNPMMNGASIERAKKGLRTAVARLRTLMIEHNSFLSGGLPFVFPRNPAVLRERGLAIYRYPKLGKTDVTAQGACIRISFESGSLGSVTSSGFYVPTRIHGDFSVSLHYQLRRWNPGEKSASFALFAQDELSEQRYYAQRRSSKGLDEEHEVLSSMQGELSDSATATELQGEFRITRKGHQVSSWHRTNGHWDLLGEFTEPDVRDVIIGAKIWGIEECGGLEVDLSDLTIDGKIPHEQIPELEARPDPRN